MPYYSVTEEDVHEFDEYDPTPYGGGYDIYLTYGRPLAPSEEICYPNSSPDSEEVDYERPQFSSDAEPSAYADDAVNAEYSSYARPKPRPGPVGAQGEGGSYVTPQPGENQPGYGESQVPGSEYGSDCGRKQDYEQPRPESGSESGFGRRPDPDSYGSEYGSGRGRVPESDDSSGSGYGRRPDPDSYGSEYGSVGGRLPQSDDSYGSGYGRRPDPDSYGSEYGSGHGRRTEYENPDPRPESEVPEPDYGSGYGRKPSYGEEPRYEDEPPRRPSYGRSEEEEYGRPRYERREGEDEDYDRKKYDENSGEEDGETRKSHQHRRNYGDE